jgi:hypothetical protein
MASTLRGDCASPMHPQIAAQTAAEMNAIPAFNFTMCSL